MSQQLNVDAQDRLVLKYIGVRSTPHRRITILFQLSCRQLSPRRMNGGHVLQRKIDAIEDAAQRLCCLDERLRAIVPTWSMAGRRGPSGDAQRLVPSRSYLRG